MSVNTKQNKRKGPKVQRRKRSRERSNIESVVDVILAPEGAEAPEFLLPASLIGEKDADKQKRKEQHGNNRFDCEKLLVSINLIVRLCPYFGPDGKRRGYEINNFELLIHKKYEEASLNAGTHKMAEDNEKEKKTICNTLEVFQEGLTSRAVTDSTKKETAGRKSMSSESGKLSRK